MQIKIKLSLFIHEKVKLKKKQRRKFIPNENNKIKFFPKQLICKFME